MTPDETNPPNATIRIRPAEPTDIKDVMRLREAGVAQGDFPAENEPPPHQDEDGPLDAINTPEGYWVAEIALKVKPATEPPSASQEVEIVKNSSRTPRTRVRSLRLIIQNATQILGCFSN